MGDFVPPTPSRDGCGFSILFWTMIGFVALISIITWPFRRIFGWMFTGERT